MGKITGNTFRSYIFPCVCGIEVREKSVRRTKPEKKPKKRGRPFKGSAPVIEPKRLDLQAERELEDNLKDLPVLCDFGCNGCKRDSKGTAGRDSSCI